MEAFCPILYKNMARISNLEIILIILVFAIFSANVSVELAQIATSVFMAAFVADIVEAFTLFGVVVYQIRGESKAK
jgi:hypothetical protein